MESNDRFSAPRSATNSSSPAKDSKLRDASRPPLEIVVPTSAEQLGLLEECVQKIEASTPLDHSIVVSIDGEIPEESIGDITSMLHGLRGDKWKLMQSSHGLNHAIDRDVGLATSEFVAVVPADRHVHDAEWFGKMQMPFTKDHTCGMVFAFDSMAGNTRPPHRWDTRYPVAGTMFMLKRFAIKEARGAVKFAVVANDYAICLQHALHSLALTTWAAPSVRVTSMVTPTVVHPKE